jgi:hypothetical protein
MTTCRLRLLAACVLGLLLTSGAGATQHLVPAGHDWELQLRGLSPGDELILMPGRHEAGRIANIKGTAKQPIVIRGLSADKPSIIIADRDGLEIEGVRHLRIELLTITGATINGLTVSPPSVRTTADEPGRWRCDLTLRDLTVERTGPTGRRDAIRIAGVSHVDLQRCAVEGWGGAAIDILDSEHVKIDSCRMQGLADHSQDAGIQVRGGSEQVRISNCTLREPGRFGLRIGGPGEPDPVGGLPAPSGPAARPDRTGQASRVNISRCVIEAAVCPISFSGSRRCTVRNVTIIRPLWWVVAVDIPVEDGQSLPAVSSKHLVFSSNLITWEPGEVRALFKTGPNYEPRTLILEQNIWWSPSDPEAMSKLARWPETPAFPQIVDLDPQLDESNRPTAKRAELFGADAI